jgi:predicted DNA binding CopG/RHH family protein
MLTNSAIKTLLVGSDYEWSIEQSYLKVLKNKEVITELYPIQNKFYNYYYRSFIHKLCYRLGVSSILKRLNKELLLFVESFQPTHIWVFKGMEVLPSTLQAFREKGIKLINYNPDNPFIFTGRGSGNKNITQSISLYDWYLSYDRSVVQQLKAMKVHADLFPFAIDYDKKDVLLTIRLSIPRLAFIGNPDQERVLFLNQLAALGVPLDVYGHDWNITRLHPSIKIFTSLSRVEYIKLVPQYKAVLNLMRIHNLDSHNMRSLEIPAFGGVQLASRTTDHAVFFKDGKEVFLFSNAAEAAEQWIKILSLSNQYLLEGVLSTQHKLLQEHSYAARIDFFLEGLENL